jgi:hypothetical protein
MSAKKRILFIANEMSPYLELTEFSEIVNRLAIKANDSGFEVRCIMPRFGTINERRHRLHEVVRLSGINVSVDNEDFPLQIKVASLPNARLQVYFLDNEDLFKRKFVFTDENEQWYDDNGSHGFLLQRRSGDREEIRLASGHYPLQRLDDGTDPGLPEDSVQERAGIRPQQSSVYDRPEYIRRKAG